MARSTLFKTIHLDCPVCNLFHQVEERVRMVSATVKGETIFCEEHFYLCTNDSSQTVPDSDDPNLEQSGAEKNGVNENSKAKAKKNREFQTESLINSNLMAARNAYRKGHGLLTSDEIAAVRDNYGLTQTEAAKLLGWGEATIARYESKAIQDEVYDTMLRLIQDNPLCAIAFLDKNGDKLSEVKRMQIRAKMLERLDTYGKEFLTRQVLTSAYVKFSVPSDFNGYKMLDIDMIEHIISYYAERVPDLYKVRLMNMLWYADALSFKTCGNSLMGLSYKHAPMGMIPIGQSSLTILKNVNVREEEDFESTKYHFYPNTTLGQSVLSKSETDILEIVVSKFRNFSDEMLVAYIQEEAAYQQTGPEEIIPFNLAKKIRG